MAISQQTDYLAMGNRLHYNGGRDGSTVIEAQGKMRQTYIKEHRSTQRKHNTDSRVDDEKIYP